MIARQLIFTAVLGALARVTGPDAAGWHTAICPFHDDHNHPNLRVRPTGFRCLACGAKGTLGRLAEKLRIEGNLIKSDRIETTYDYLDEDRKLLFQVVRLRDPKDFKQRRPDGAGSWLWNLEGVRRVLYRLPELLAADPDEPVFTCEGEKDADNLAELGLVATTNPGGASKWRPEYNAFLAGRKVVVLADNDQAGEQHAESVAQCLLA